METHYMGMEIPKCWQRLEKVLKSGIDRVILHGPPGTGKTYGALTMGIGDRPSVRLVCTPDMTTSQVDGMFMPNERGTFSWHDGAGTEAWRDGGRLVIDEVDKASSDVSSMLLAYTDSIASATHRLPTKERIAPADGFSVIMTSNIESKKELPIALQDRFPVAIYINAPHPAALMKLPEDLRAVAAKIVSNPDPDRRASLRAFDAFVTLRNTCDLAEAAEIAFGEELAESVIDTIRIGLLGRELV